MSWTEAQLERYSRNILVDEIGGEGQQKLLASKVLVIGAGGLGSPVLFYLAAAGIGTLGIVDSDSVELSNLQRQIVHTADAIGVSKVKSAKARLSALNPDVAVVAHPLRLDDTNATEIIAAYDIVVDGSDNFSTRFLVNKTCYEQKKTLVSAAIRGFEGQLSVYKPYLGKGHPCYQCFHPSIPEEGSVPTCTQSGVLGAIAGVMGSLQATEVVKEILQIGESLSSNVLIYHALTSRFRLLRLQPDPECPQCGSVLA